MFPGNEATKFFAVPFYGNTVMNILQLHFSSSPAVPCLHSEPCTEMIQKLYMVCFLVWVDISFPHSTSFLSAVCCVFLSFSICFLLFSYPFSLAFFLFPCQIPCDDWKRK